VGTGSREKTRTINRLEDSETPVGMQIQSVRDGTYVVALEARFARAERHSARVRFLRRAIPAVIALACLGLLAISLFNPFRLLAKLPIDVGNIVVSGTSITMESPHIAGFTNDGRPYEIRARSARQDVTDPSNVELQVLSARVQNSDGSTVTADAKHGFYSNKTQKLDLSEGIVLKSSVGYEAELIEATIDMVKGTVVSEKPVAVKLLNGDLKSQRLEITDNGALVKFDGGVSMDLVPDDGGEPQQAAKQH
jgi:lipopolysaccharide export system protein LptC